MEETSSGVSEGGGWQMEDEEGGGQEAPADVGGTNWIGQGQRGYASAGWGRHASAEHKGVAASPGM